MFAFINFVVANVAAAYHRAEYQNKAVLVVHETADRRFCHCRAFGVVLNVNFSLAA